MQKTYWHTLTEEETLRKLGSTVHGILPAQAQERLVLYGPNELETSKPPSMLYKFLRQFDNILIYVLLAAALITALMQHWGDTAVIMAVVFINAVFGFIQETKAENALAAIRGLLSLNSHVIRDGIPCLIPASELVCGDVVTISAGDKVPADLRLFETFSMETQEAALTGESMGVEKSTAPCPKASPLTDRTCIAYAGTLVTRGQGKGVVVATGKQTEVGQIGQMLSSVDAPLTPLVQKINRFARHLTGLILLTSLGIFIYGVLIRDFSPAEMFMVVVGITVSAIPEGLPAVISITLALGVRTMARRSAIIRHLPAIESLGSVNVICTDKTGTLTRNELTVSDIITADHAFKVTGAGYSPEGEILFNDREISLKEYPAVYSLTHAALLNNDSQITLRKGVWELNGEPTEGALMSCALKAGHNSENTRRHWPRKAMIPFSAEARFMATMHPEEDSSLVYVKGAPERLLSMCAREQAHKGKERALRTDYWQEKTSLLAAEGKRVLAIASCKSCKETLEHADVESGLTLLGIVGITDVLREEAAEAIKSCYNAGIEVKMITGDHVVTAGSIGKKLNITNSEQVITGTDIDKLSETALREIAPAINIYARMHPEHKLKLVKALQATGNIVAMTGDGVNDAPALKAANIGIAMGLHGTEAAKESSQMVLADDNFSTIVHAVEEGRGIYDKIQRTIKFMMVTDGAEALTLVLGIFGGFALPILPIQILWVNMITAVTLSLAFAFGPGDKKVMERAPLSANAPFFTSAALFQMSALGLAMGVIIISIFLYYTESPIEIRRTMAINLLVFLEIAYLLFLYPFNGIRRDNIIRVSLPVIVAIISVIAAQIIFTYAPFMQEIFSTSGLSLVDWLTIATISAAMYIILKLLSLLPINVRKVQAGQQQLAYAR